MSQSFVRSSGSIPANTSVTEKRTVITTSSGLSSGNFGNAGADDEDATMYYRSSITPRQTSISRTTLPTSPLRTSRTVEISSAFTSGHLPLGTANVAATGVISFKSNREKEKKDMQDLNERFANYIEKVRFLEAQNKKLASELEQLRSHWGKETNKIKLMYETELTEARKLIDDTNKEKSRLQLRVGQLEEQLNDVMRQLDEAKKWRGQDRETINKLNQQVSELEGEIRMLRRTNDSLDTERQRDKATINRLQEELEKLRIDLSNETIARLDAENKYQTLLEELEFLKSVHEQELKELSALAYRDTTAENREFWKNELSQAIRDIQQEYDMKVDQIRGEMETFYNLKVQEFRTGATKQNMEVTHAREETKKLQKQLGDFRTRNSDLEARNAQLEKQYQDMLREMEQKDHEHAMEINSLKEEMNKLRAELEAMLIELQTLMDAKLSLELEIAAYRKLLEGEETRIPLRSSYRHSYTPYSASTNKTDSNGAPYGAPASSSKFTYISSRGRDVADTTSPSKVKATEMADSKPKATPEPHKVEADSKAAVSADFPLVKKIDKEESKLKEKQTVAGKSLTPVKQETFHKIETSEKLFQEMGEAAKEKKMMSGDDSQWQKDIEDDIILKQVVKDTQKTPEPLEEEMVCQKTEFVMMEPMYEPKHEELGEEKATISAAGDVEEDVLVVEKNEDQAESVPMLAEEEVVHATQISGEHGVPPSELTSQDVEDALSEGLLKESEGTIGEDESLLSQTEEPAESGHEENGAVITDALGSAVSATDVDETDKGDSAVEDSQIEDRAEAPELPHTPSPSPTEKFEKVSEGTILDQAAQKVAEQASAQIRIGEKVLLEDKTSDSETKVDVVEDLSPVKEDIQEASQITKTTPRALSAEKEDNDETICVEAAAETTHTEEDKDETISAEEAAETTHTEEDKDEAISEKEASETMHTVEDKDEQISGKEAAETTYTVEDKDEQISGEEATETTYTVEDKDEQISGEEATETTYTVEDKDEQISGEEATETTYTVEDKDEQISGEEATETTYTVEDKDEQISGEEATETTYTVEDKDEQISGEEAAETKHTVEDRDETISAEEAAEITHTVEDKDEQISGEEVAETTHTVEDEDKIISAEEAAETTHTEEDKDEKISHEEAAETIHTEEDKDETMSVKEAPEITHTEKDKDEPISIKQEGQRKVLSVEKEEQDKTSAEEATETTPRVLSADKKGQDDEEETALLEGKVNADEENVFLETEGDNVTECEDAPAHEISHEDQEGVSATCEKEDVVGKEIADHLATDVEDSEKQIDESAIEDSHITEVSELSKEEEVTKETIDVTETSYPTEEQVEDGNKVITGVTSAEVKEDLLTTSGDDELKNLSKSIVEETVEEAIIKQVAMKTEVISVETEDGTAVEENINQDNDEEEEIFITETYVVSVDGRITEERTTGDLSDHIDEHADGDSGYAVETAHTVIESDSPDQELRKTYSSTTSTQIDSGTEPVVISTTEGMKVKDVEVLDKIETASDERDEDSKEADVVSQVADDAPEVEEKEDVDDKQRKVKENEETDENVKIDGEETEDKGEVELSGLSENESQEKITMLGEERITHKTKGEEQDDQVELPTSGKEASKSSTAISRESITKVAATTKDKDSKTDLERIHVETTVEEIVKEAKKTSSSEEKNVEEIHDEEHLQVAGTSETDSVVESIRDENVKSIIERVGDIDMHRSDTGDKSDDKASVKSTEFVSKEEKSDDQGSDRQEETSFIQKSPPAEKATDVSGKNIAEEEEVSGSGIKTGQSSYSEHGEGVSKEEEVVELTNILTTEQVLKDSSSESLPEEKVGSEAGNSVSSKHADVVEKHLIEESVTGESIENHVTKMATHESGQSVSVKQTISEHQESLSTKQTEGKHDVSPQTAGKHDVSPQTAEESIDDKALMPSEMSLVKTHSSQQEIVHTSSKSQTTRVQHTETKVVTSVVSSTQEAKLIGSSSDSGAQAVTSFMSKEDWWGDDQKDETGPMMKMSGKHEHSDEHTEEQSEDGSVVKVERKVHKQSHFVLESFSTEGVKGEPLNVGLHEDSTAVLSHAGTTSSENEIVAKHKESKVKTTLIQSPSAEDNVIISKTFSLSESSAKFLSESGFIKDELHESARGVQDLKPKESVDVEIGDGEKRKQTESQKSHEEAQDSSQMADKSNKVRDGEKEIKDQIDSKQNVDPQLEEHTSINEKTFSDGSPSKGQEKGEMHFNVTVTDVSDEEGPKHSHDSDIKDNLKGSTTSSAHVEINVEEQHDDAMGDLGETAEVKDVDDEIEEEILLVNGVKEDLLEASSPEISTFDQARADISIATPLPGEEKGIHDDTDDDVLNDAEMANGGDADGVTTETGPGAEEGSPTDTDTVSLHDVSASTEVHSLGKEVTESSQKTPDDDALAQEGGSSTSRDILAHDKTSAADIVVTHEQRSDGHTGRVGLRSVVEQTLGVRQSGTARLADIINVAEGQAYESAGDSQLSVKMMKGEVSAKTTYQRTANGPVSIAEANPEGKFILLENNPSAGARKEMNLDGWKLCRVVDNKTKRPYEYTFRNFVLKPGKSIKIFARSQASQAGPNDLVFRDAENWGAGSEVVTTLLNEKGEEKASHIQKTSYNQ